MLSWRGRVLVPWTGQSHRPCAANPEGYEAQLKRWDEVWGPHCHSLGIKGHIWGYWRCWTYSRQCIALQVFGKRAVWHALGRVSSRFISGFGGSLPLVPGLHCMDLFVDGSSYIYCRSFVCDKDCHGFEMFRFSRDPEFLVSILLDAVHKNLRIFLFLLFEKKWTIKVNCEKYRTIKEYLGS